MPSERFSIDNVDYERIPQYAKRLDTIFSNGIDINKTAYLNWRIGFADISRRQFVVVGEAFFTSAFHLVEECLEDNWDKKADSWIFPILFNLVHGIEVYLKAINSVFSVELGKERGITNGGHDIRSLCATARNLIAEYKEKNKNNTTEEMLTAIKVVQNFIANIYKKTDDMTFARYPMNKNEEGHFYIQNLGNEVIDLELLKEQIALVYRMLDFIYERQESCIQIEAEAMKDWY